MQVYHNIQQLELEVYIVRGEVFRQVMALLHHWVLGSRPLVTFVTVSRTVSHVSAENQGTFSDYHYWDTSFGQGHFLVCGDYNAGITKSGSFQQGNSPTCNSGSLSCPYIGSRLSKN